MESQHGCLFAEECRAARRLWGHRHLVRHGPIVTRGTSATLAAKNATGTIPVVMAAVGDPLETGLVASLARPGGNVMGLSSTITDLQARRVELLRELVPGATRIAALCNMSN